MVRTGRKPLPENQKTEPVCFRANKKMMQVLRESKIDIPTFLRDCLKSAESLAVQSRKDQILSEINILEKEKTGLIPIELIVNEHKKVKAIETAARLSVLDQKDQAALAKKQNERIEKDLIIEFSAFCKMRNLREKDLKDFIINGEQTRLIGPNIEMDLSEYLISKNLPGNLNILRPLLLSHKKILQSPRL